jgi:hypothetical protein
MWGPAAQSANSLAMTLSQCAWELATQGGTKFGVEVMIVVQGVSSAPTCAGEIAPGEFGWLKETTDNTCTAAIDLTQNGYAAGSETGNNASADCKAKLKSYIDSQSPIYIPIFDTTKGTGDGASYNLVGLAAFILTGYARMPGGGLPQNYFSRPPVEDCPNGIGSHSCIFGHFTQALVPVTTTIGGGTNFGAIAIKLAG